MDFGLIGISSLLPSPGINDQTITACIVNVNLVNTCDKMML